MATKKKMLQAAAGNAAGGGGGGAALNVEDVFSTYLYEGNGGSQVIQNGIALGDLKEADDGVYYLSSPSSVIGNNSAGNTVTATLDGSVALSSGTTKFASNSYYFNGASNIRLSSALIDTSSSFCFETWVYFDSTGAAGDMAMLLAQYKSGEDGRLLFGAQGGNLVVRYNGSTVALTASVSSSTWYHVAWSYDGTTHRLFVNGTLEDSTTTDFPIYTGVTTQLGGTDPTLLSGYDLSGNMEDIRITTGDARYTSSFTPPTASLPVTTAATVLVSGEGGLVWLKGRNNGNSHYLHDSERTITKWLQSQTIAAEQNTGPVTSFNSNGFSLGFGQGNGGANSSGDTFASWTFRKAPKFFTCVQYTGDGNDNRTVNHNLGSSPGMVIVKKTDAADSWIVWHRSVPTGYLSLNVTSGLQNYTSRIKSANDTTFTLGTSGQTNSNGATYVAYLFAHNDGDGGFGPDGDADIIKCGSYTTDGSEEATIDLGFEPQWVLFKRTDSSAGGDWNLFDTMRGLTADTSGGGANLLEPNTGDAELATSRIAVTPTGFKVDNYGANRDFIYIAIRRGTKVPESATEVFEPTAYTGNNTANRTVGSLTVDMNIIMDRTNTSTGLSDYHTLFDRVRGEDNVFKLTRTDSEGNSWGNTYYNLDQQYGFSNGSNTSYFNNSGSSYISYIWKRAPGFCDVVAYSGDGVAGRTVSHNLGVAPEMMWVKKRDTNKDWIVYADGLETPSLTASHYHLHINQNFSSSQTNVWHDTQPTSSEFYLGSGTEVNQSGGTYIAYLFASLPGISKVGSYTGNGGTQTIDCGFTSGARFVLIKRTDSIGSWYVYDTARGIVAGNDSELELNTTNPEDTSADVIDPHPSGFSLTGSRNISGASYIFYAIA